MLTDTIAFIMIKITKSVSRTALRVYSDPDQDCLVQRQQDLMTYPHETLSQAFHTYNIPMQSYIYQQHIPRGL